MPSNDLRADRHERTRHDLLAAAIDLFAEHGYGAVTVEQIAEAAGVSRRTAYRRFRSKDDILLELPRRWLTIWDDSVDQHADASAPERIERAGLAVSAHVDAHRRETLVGMAALTEAPGLTQASVAGDDWHRRVVALLVGDGWDERDAQLLAGAYLGGIDAMLALWAADDGAGQLVELNQRLNERLAPLWSR